MPAARSSSRLDRECRSCAPSPSLPACSSPSTLPAPPAAASRRSCGAVASVGGLAHQVEFVVQVLVEFATPLRAASGACRPTSSVRSGRRWRSSSDRSCPMTCWMLGRSIFTATASPAFRRARMHLRDGGGGDRRVVEFGEHLGWRRWP